MRASEPVARITFFAFKGAVLPSFATSTVNTPFCAGPVSLPYPFTVSTLFFFIRNSRPLACLATIFDFALLNRSPVQLARIHALDAEFFRLFQVIPEFGVE